MDVTTAYALVGVERGATMLDARTAFRSRSKLLHPDRADGSTMPEAGRAMAQLTQAWSIVQHHVQAAGESPSADETSRPRASGECEFCGWEPAAPIVLRRTVGVVIFWRVHRVAFDVCRVCARSLYAEYQAKSLTLGWWGMIAPLANVVNMTRNRLTLARHRRSVSGPKSHDERVESLASGPLDYRSPWTRPAGLLATVVALVVLASLGATWANRVVPNTTQPSNPAFVSPVIGVGGCLDSTGLAVGCDAPSAAWTLTEQVATADACATDGYAEAFTNSIGSVYCANHWP